jgi:hypothetical protein
MSIDLHKIQKKRRGSQLRDPLEAWKIAINPGLLVMVQL